MLYNTFTQAVFQWHNNRFKLFVRMAVPATLTSTISTCDQGGTGAVTHTNITYTWYYNTTNTNVISGGTVTVQTSTGLNTNTVSDDFYATNRSNRNWNHDIIL
jgi:hypothetical protein